MPLYPTHAHRFLPLDAEGEACWCGYARWRGVIGSEYPTKGERMKLQERTATVTVDYEMAAFIAQAIAAAYPNDTAAREWFEIADRLMPDGEILD